MKTPRRGRVVWVAAVLAVLGVSPFYAKKMTSDDRAYPHMRAAERSPIERQPAEPLPRGEAPAAAVRPSSASAQQEPKAPLGSDTSIEYAMQQITSGDMKLALQAYYRQHVLLDSSQREGYHKFLADPSVHLEMKQDLLYPKEPEATTQSNVKRLMIIDYLRAGLAWEKNPERQNLLSSLEEMILEDNFKAGLTANMRRSLAGNKQELFALLREYAPDRAGALVGKAEGTRLAEFIQFIAKQDEFLQAKEKEAAIARASQP